MIRTNSNVRKIAFMMNDIRFVMMHIIIPILSMLIAIYISKIYQARYNDNYQEYEQELSRVLYNIQTTIQYIQNHHDINFTHYIKNTRIAADAQQLAESIQYDFPLNLYNIMTHYVENTSSLSYVIFSNQNNLKHIPIISSRNFNPGELHRCNLSPINSTYTLYLCPDPKKKLFPNQYAIVFRYFIINMISLYSAAAYLAKKISPSLLSTYLSKKFRPSFRFIVKSVNPLLEQNHWENMDSYITRQFLHNLTHELRNPISTLIGMSNIIKNQALDFYNAQTLYTETIDKESKKLMEMVDNLIEIIKITNNNIPVNNKSYVSINDIISKILKHLQEKIYSQQITIDYDSTHQFVPIMFLDYHKTYTAILHIITGIMSYCDNHNRIIINTHYIEKEKKASVIFSCDIEITQPDRQQVIYNHDQEERDSYLPIPVPEISLYIAREHLLSQRIKWSLSSKNNHTKIILSFPDKVLIINNNHYASENTQY